MLAAPAWRFVCYTEAVTEGKEPLETDGEKPESAKPEPSQAVVAQMPNTADSSSNQPEPSGVGVKKHAESTDCIVKDEGSCSPAPNGKYDTLI